MDYDEFIKQKRMEPIENNYYHVHHIIPRSLGGSNDESNLIKLKYKDHWTAHKLLYEKYPDNIIIKRIWATFKGYSTAEEYEHICIQVKDHPGCYYNKVTKQFESSDQKPPAKPPNTKKSRKKVYMYRGPFL